MEQFNGTELTPLHRLLCGGLAGITSVTATYPLDIVRTRLSIQSASFAELQNNPSKRFPGMFTTMRLMYTTEGGFVALYRGIIPTVAGVAPYVSLPCLEDNYTQLRLTIKKGWLELHDLRISAKIFNARW